MLPDNSPFQRQGNRAPVTHVGHLAELLAPSSALAGRTSAEGTTGVTMFLSALQKMTSIGHGRKNSHEWAQPCSEKRGHSHASRKGGTAMLRENLKTGHGWICLQVQLGSPCLGVCKRSMLRFNTTQVLKKMFYFDSFGRTTERK